MLFILPKICLYYSLSPTSIDVLKMFFASNRCTYGCSHISWTTHFVRFFYFLHFLFFHFQYMFVFTKLATCLNFHSFGFCFFLMKIFNTKWFAFNLTKTKWCSLLIKRLDNDDKQFSPPFFLVLYSIFAIRRLKFSRGQRLDEKHKKSRYFLYGICIYSWYTRRLVMLGNQVQWNRIHRIWHSNKYRKRFKSVVFFTIGLWNFLRYIIVFHLHWEQLCSVYSSVMDTIASFLSCI